VGSELYNKLVAYFIEYLRPLITVCCQTFRARFGTDAEILSFQKAETLEDVGLLEYYAAEWDKYKASADYLKNAMKAGSQFIRSPQCAPFLIKVLL
jgi:phage terminase small subunit